VNLGVKVGLGFSLSESSVASPYLSGTHLLSQYPTFVEALLRALSTEPEALIQ